MANYKITEEQAAELQAVADTLYTAAHANSAGQSSPHMATGKALTNCVSHMQAACNKLRALIAKVTGKEDKSQGGGRWER